MCTAIQAVSGKNSSATAQEVSTSANMTAASAPATLATSQSGFEMADPSSEDVASS